YFVFGFNNSGASGGSSIVIWDFASKREGYRFSDERGDGNRVAFSPDGKIVAIARRNPRRPIVLYQIASKLLVREIESLNKSVSVSSVSFVANSRFLACGTSDGSVFLLDVFSGRTINQCKVKCGPVICLADNRVGSYLASGNADSTIHVWKLPALIDSRENGDLQFDDAKSKKTWDDLSSDNATVAYNAMSDLIKSPKQAVLFLGDRIRPVVSP